MLGKHRPLTLALVASVLLSAWPDAVNAQDETELPQKLVVATKQAPPFAIKNDDGKWTGISIDLWRKIAEEQKFEYEFRELGIDELLTSLEDGTADVAVAALTITNGREQKIDFTHPYYTSGLGIAVAADESSVGLFAVLRAIFSWEFFQILGGLILVLLAIGLLMWFVERRANRAQFGGSVARGLGAGMWWSAVTMTTVGYGDKAPVTLAGRLVAIVWMFASLFMISVFTASVASLVLADRLESHISGLKDLPGARVGTIPDSTSDQYLRRQRIRVRPYNNMPQALAALHEGEIEAAVYDAPILQYLINQDYSSYLAVLPIRFETQNYGIGLPTGSELREPINQSLLKATSDPDWQNTLYRYLGE